jgi:ribosomal protein S18 acetylase RimI-like enzyme
VFKLQLSVRARNEAAIALYRREGFALEGRERAQILDEEGFEDNLVMAKFLRAV